MAVTRGVLGAGPLGMQGSAIQTSAYSLDLFQGPVLAGSRPTAMGGAFAGVAEGVDGNPVNAAAPALRVPWSIDWFDYDWTAGLTLPATLRRTDFDNNGQTGFSYDSFYFATLGANLQFGAWGFGAIVDGQMYDLSGLPTVAGVPPYLHALLARGHLLVSRTLFGGEWLVGVGARFATLNFSASERPDGGGTSRDLFSMNGAAPEAGVIWAPHALPVRAGLSARLPVRSAPDPANQTVPNAEGDTVIGSMVLPSSTEVPWEIEGGVAVQIGRRRLNVAWVNPRDLSAAFTEARDRPPPDPARTEMPANQAAELQAAQEQRMKALHSQVRRRLKARYRSIARQKVLLSLSVLVSGPVRSAVGVESFLQQVVDRSGERASVTPRLGIEGEPLEHWLQVRAGTYLEPTRFRAGSPRLHATLGFDLRLLDWSVFGLLEEDSSWRAGGLVDGARDYFGWGVAVGLWH